jgi:hypothetical protein
MDHDGQPGVQTAEGEMEQQRDVQPVGGVTSAKMCSTTSTMMPATAQ